MTTFTSGQSSSPTQTKQLSNLGFNFYLVEHKRLQLSLQKVKGHSNDLINSIADELANAGIHIKDTIIINFNFFHNNSLGLIKWNNIYVIDQNDQNIRKWSNNITQPLIFNSMINNMEMAPINQQIVNGNIGLLPKNGLTSIP